MSDKKPFMPTVDDEVAVDALRDLARSQANDLATLTAKLAKAMEENKRLHERLELSKTNRNIELAYAERLGMERAAKIVRTHGGGALAQEIEDAAAALYARRTLSELEDQP